MNLKLLFLLSLISFSAFGQPQRIILDADTGNEVDDPYAIARALIEPTWDVLALTAAQWQTSHWAVPQSMENSHRINQLLVGHLEMERDVPTMRGGVARMFDWGDKAQHSAAAYEIIKQAKATPEDQKLTVIALGALTNVASAIFIDPSIETRISLYWLGTSYDFNRGIMGTIDFNCSMDIQALHILLNSEVDMHVIPVNIAAQMQFNYAETEKELRGKHPLGDFLCDRWKEHLDGGRKKRVIWDLALIQAMIHPEWATVGTVTTSKDYGSKEIHYYQAIEADKMRTEFFKTLNEF